MNIRIDDDVPLPQPDKPSTWISKALGTEQGWQKALHAGKPGPVTEAGLASEWVTGGKIERTTFDSPLTVMPDEVIDAVKRGRSVNQALRDFNNRYPAEPKQDAKGVPTVDCFLVGGPLNGKHGPIVGTAKVVELNMYAADGSVSSVELYELGDRGDLGARYWKGTKQ